MNEKLKVLLWCILHYPELKWKSWQTRHTKSRLRLMTSLQTVEHIIQTKASVARYGDGELQMISHYLRQGDEHNFGVDTFQHYNPELARRLLDILVTPREGLLVCLPYQLKVPTISNLHGELFWEREWLSRMDFLSQYALDRDLGDTNFTRFYMGRRDIDDYPTYISRLQEIWRGRKILIVEGKFSRLGVGNDLFSCAESIRRITCPPTDAFMCYDQILSTIESYAQTSPRHEDLILLALGHTATILAGDLSQKGHQAIDLGHIDVEYEWYRMGAKSKVAIPGKYVNEVASGRITQVTEEDELYRSQIVASIE